jgi:acetyl-CoA synthetase
MSELAWEPTPEYVERANVTRLMRAHGIETIDELRRRSVEDIAWYWDAVVDDLGIPFAEPYERVVDDSGGIEWAKWFVGGRVNLAAACVDRHAAERPDEVALIGESETGEVRRLTFGGLRREVDRVAAGLRRAGVGKGDAVGVFMPMCPEAVIAAYAVAKVGAIYLPIFSGFAAPAVAARLRDAEAKLLFTADATWRRGSHGLMKPVADEAVADVPSIEHVVVREHLGVEIPMQPGRDVTWAELVDGLDGPVTPEPTDSEDVFMIAYTSGTTGRPKGSVHVHGGFLVKIASEVAYQTDVHPGEVGYWVTDMGWIMGPLMMVGCHANGAAMVMYEGAPDYPEPDRVWASVEKHGVHMLGVSPTLIRALKQQGDEHALRHDLASLRILGSTGEPWNPDPYRWLMRMTGGDVPIINLSGGTEVGACFLSPFPVEPIKECSLGGPSLGMDMDVFDPKGRSMRGEVGELVCKQPWPAMTRGVWKDPQRYVDSYWSMYPGVWRHGDWAMVDSDGQWFLFGRSDDAINVAGKRVGPAEVESVLVGHPKVVESAVVGVPDAVKGEAIWCFCVTAEGADDAIAEELRDLVAKEMGRPFKPARVVLVEALPKTRSAKIIRRAVRAVAAGEDPGDLSSAENPEALDAIRAALAAEAG